MVLSCLLLAACSGLLSVEPEPEDAAEDLTALTFEVQPPLLAIDTGDVKTLRAVFKDQNGESVQLDGTLEWTSTDPGIADVDPAGNVTARATGSTTVMVSFSSSNGKGKLKDSTQVDSSPPGSKADTVIVSPDSTKFAEGDSHDFDALAVHVSGRVLDRPIKWSSSDPSVVSVQDDGTVIGQAPGSATIEAKSGGATGEADAVIEPDSDSGSDSGSEPAPEPQDSRAPAFPGAAGYGAAATGGRGGEVYEVTSLDDDASNPQPGTLRHALKQTGPRTIVFRVAGEIQLNGGAIVLRDEHSNVTVAGQTAPGSGITIRGGMQIRGADNLIFRYLRMRDDVPNNITIIGGHDIIFDHVTAQFATNDNVEAWLTYEIASAEPIYNVTLSRSIIGPGIHSERHATAGGWRGKHYDGEPNSHLDVYDVDYHHNYWVHNHSRQPTTISAGAKVINNVVYNYNWKGMTTSDTVRVDYIGNHVERGPIHAGDPAKRGQYSHRPYPSGEPDNPHRTAEIYMEGNVALPQFPTPPEDQWQLMQDHYTDEPISERHRRLDPLPDPEYPVTPTSAQEAFSSVLADVGANRRLTCDGEWMGNVDALDQKFIDHGRNGTGPTALYTSISEAGGMPAVDRGTPCDDADGDGMPDRYEDRFGLDSQDPSDRNLDPDGDSYTNLQEYLSGNPPQ